MATSRAAKTKHSVKPARVSIPEATKRLVLGEFNHSCAMCGKHGAQLHHIDEDRSNNEPMNLIPLCPNHHLTEQHHPTRRHDPIKLQLFRKYKHTLILKPQFQAIFKRMRFMYLDQSGSPRDEILAMIRDLTRFLSVLEMGEYFSKQVAETLRAEGSGILNVNGQDTEAEWDAMNVKFWENARCAAIDKIKANRADVEKIVVEMLDFQKWDTPIDRSSGV